MLGHSTSGKTTFMAALYYRMTNGLYNYKMKYDKWANYWYKRHTQNNCYYTLEEAEKEEKELNQTELGKKLGITQRKLSYLECGKCEPNVDDIRAVCNFFKIIEERASCSLVWFQFPKI